MALPTTFGGLTAATGAQLDNNFAALGNIAVLPGALAGTNTIVSSLLSNTPTITAYQNYQIFSGIAAASNTTTVTFAVGGLSALNVYKDGPTGPVLLTGGEIAVGTSCLFIYDGALNSSAGGFHLISNGARNGIPVSPSSIQVNGGNYLVRQLSTIASVTFPAILPGATNDQTVVLSGVSVNDVVALGLPAAPTNSIVFQGFVSAAGTVTIRAANYTSAATITPGGANYRIGVQGYI